MKSNSIYNTAKVVMAALSLGAMTTACTDWDDHYEANSSEIGSSTASLWENISSNKDLSDFAALAKKAGYDKILSASQAYTVWAPLNGSFDYESLNNLDAETLKKQFLQNHVSHFNYPASGSINEKVFMVNEKMNIFEGNGQYTMGGLKVVTPNIANANGIMHTIDGKLDFNFNIYESLNADYYPLDSISAYFARYDRKQLDVNNSVKGPVVDGEITYLDSVFTEYNLMANMVGAYIDREDSSYTMIMPTNKAWESRLNEIKAMYEYIPEYVYFREFPKTLTGADAAENKTKELIDNVYLADSLTHLQMLPSLFYNNNLYDNVKLKDLQTGGTLNVDSLYITCGTKLYSEDAADIFVGAEKVERSNGAIWVTDTLRFKPWVYKPYIKVEAEWAKSLNLFANNFNSNVSSVNVTPADINKEVEGKLSNFSYLEVRPALPSSNPEVDFYLPGIRKGKYVLYIGVVPANIDSKTFNPEVKPNLFQVKAGYHDLKGNLKETTLGSKFENDPAKIDTMRIGEIDFPVATAGLSNAHPYIRILSRVTSSTNDTRDRTLRIDFIQLIPKELDDYIKEHPGYKWEDESDK